MTPVRRNQNSWLPSIFNDFFERDWPDRHGTTSPAVNILENETCYKVEVAAPGMTKEDFKVHLNEDNELLITLEKRTEPKETEKAGQTEKAETTEKAGDAKKDTYLRREFSYTQFRQSLLLPDNIERDKISARMENGVMTIDIPKKRIEATASAARQIEVQ